VRGDHNPRRSRVTGVCSCVCIVRSGSYSLVRRGKKGSIDGKKHFPLKEKKKGQKAKKKKKEKVFLGSRITKKPPLTKKSSLSIERYRKNKRLSSSGGLRGKNVCRSGGVFISEVYEEHPGPCQSPPGGNKHKRKDGMVFQSGNTEPTRTLARRNRPVTIVEKGIHEQLGRLGKKTFAQGGGKESLRRIA